VSIDFKSLINLQNTDELIIEISEIIEKNPSKINTIDSEIEASIEAATAAKQDLADNQKKRRNLEANLQDINIQIEKYKHQLNNVKTNIEYRLLLKEIDNAQNKIKVIEEQILEEMLNADEIGSKIKEAEKIAEETKRKLTIEKDSLIQENKKREEERQNLYKEKENISPLIPSNLMNLYNDLFEKNVGIALSPVTDDFCSICQIRIRPQVLNELITQKKIILCENCGRILYWKNNS
jgi:predicted  nucleic acid-binding Zn-ribbon protein